jgi:hypothetical protein
MACGTVLQKTLQPGEKILVDTDSVLCFEQSITLDVQWVGSPAAVCCGGEGCVDGGEGEGGRRGGIRICFLAAVAHSPLQPTCVSLLRSCSLASSTRP